MKSENIENLGSLGTKTIVAGTGLTSFGWLTSNEFLGLVGALVAVAGLCVTWYYKRAARNEKARFLIRLEERQVREHEMRMRLMEKTGVPVASDYIPLFPQEEDEE